MKKHITADAIANRVRQLRSAHKGAFLLVEGEDDEKLYGQFVDLRACRIQIAHGKPNLVQALEVLEREGFRGVVAIADADFAILEGLVPESPNLIFTDAHDMECMLLASPALEKVLREFGDGEKIGGKDVRGHLLSIGTPIGYVRWLSKRSGLSLLFDGMEFAHFLPERTVVLDTRAFLDELQTRSRQGLVPVSVWEDVAALRREDHDPWHVCCGHDLVEILSIGLRRLWGGQTEADVKPMRLEGSLRLAYDRAYFGATRLYVSIQAWETANAPFLVLSR